MRFNRRATVALPLALALLATACGGDDEDPGSAEPTDAETTDEEEPSDDEEDPGEQSAPEAAASGSLTIWADEKRVAVMEEIAPAFTDATGVEVNIELVPFDDIREQVNLAAPAGEGPDLFIGANDWAGELAANGVIAPIDLGGKASEFSEVAVNAFGFEGATYGVPYAIEAVALYVNTDLISEVPATFDELGPACEAAGAANCVAVPGGGASADAYHNIPFVQAYGATIFAYDPETGSYDASEVLLDSEPAIQGVSYLDSQVEAGVVANTDYEAAKNLFYAGDAAFWLTGPWELPDLRNAETNPDVSFDVALIPPIGDQPVAPFVGAQGFYVNAFSDNELLAQTFLLDFVATQDTQQALFEADPRGPAWVAVADGLDDAQVQTFAESAANGLPQPNIPEMNGVWGPLGDNILQVRNGELDAAAAMQAAAEAARASVAG